MSLKAIQKMRVPRKVTRVFKVPGKETPKLFKFVSSATFAFDPFNLESRSIREVWRDLSSSRYAAANPKAKLNYEIIRGPSSLRVAFIDGRETIFEPDTLTAQELLSDIWYNAFTLEFEFLKDNKPLPT